MDKVLVNWEASYYLEPFAGLCAFYAIYKLLLTTSELKFRSLFLAYSLSVLNLFILGDIIIYLGVSFTKKTVAIELMNLIFALIEAYVFYAFYVSIIENKSFKSVLRFLSIATYAFIMSGVFYLLNDNYSLEVRTYLDIIFTLDLSLLIFPAIWYFYELSSQKNTYEYKILLLSLCFTGYCLLSVPFYSILDWLKIIHNPGYNLLFALHYLCIASVCLALATYAPSSYQMKLNFFKRQNGKFVTFVQFR